jgi:hypothetical protein
MRPDLPVKISMDVLSAIVFIRPCRSAIFTFLKVLVFHYLSGTLLLFILWLTNSQFMKSVIVYIKTHS